MGSKVQSMHRMSWEDIRRSDRYRGRWVALDNVRYDPATTQPMEADIVDVDDDLADLCGRVREASLSACAILFCEEETPSTSRAHRPAARATQH
jgi:hypothetical protein